MSFSVLSTKLFIPPPRTGAVARPVLVEKLLSGVTHSGSFAILSGPAGFGKTTLLSEFVIQIQQPVAWLSLEEGDNDPNRFWTYLISACQTVLKEVGETTLAFLRTPQPQTEDTIPTLFINDLNSQDHPLVLVLDDFHTIQNPSIHSSILFLLDHLPPNLFLVVSTRTDPPWPLARYRARNRLIEIRAQDLRFSLDEAAEFLHHTMGLNLSIEDLAALEERTEGWVAGLQLAALSMQGRSNSSTFIKDFTGSHVYIAEYLVDEVIRQQPEDMQTFLLKTAILERLNANLCEAVTQSHDGQDKLKALQQANIFIIPLDDEGRWFRYHHLFADLLKARLQSSLSKAAIRELHQFAATWYEQSGMTSEAVDHALAAADYSYVVQLTEVAALPMILEANVRTVERWLKAIPSDYIEKSPRLNMAYAWMNLFRGTPLQAVPYIDRLRVIFSTSEADKLSPSVQAEWLAIQSEHLISQGKPQESRDLAIKAQKMIPAVDPIARSMIFITLAKAYQLTLDFDRAAEIFHMIVLDARRKGDMTFEVLGTSGQAQMVLKQGQLHRTYEIANEGIRRLESSGKHVTFSATLYDELGQVFYQWHQFDQVKVYLRRSLEISGKSGYSDSEIYFHIMLSKINLIDGDLDGSVQEMQKANHLASTIPPTMVRANIISQQIRTELALNNPSAAEQLLSPDGFSFGESFSFPSLDPGSPMTLAAGLLYNSAFRILLYHVKREQDPSNLGSSIDLAQAVFQGELQSHLLTVALETLLILSQLYAVLGEPQLSLAAGAQAIELAEPEGFISIFVEEGQPVADILAELLNGRRSGKVRSQFIQKILDAFSSHSHPPKVTNKTSAAKVKAESVPLLVEPLTTRELQVLRLITDGDSNQRIAEKLVITVSAVKKHTGNIYGKLSVNSRTQAISRARQLGLLATDS